MTLEESSILIKNINSLSEQLKPCQQLKPSIKEIKDLSIISSQIQQLMSATETIRDLYSNFVERYYELNNPFPENREDTEENVKEDFLHMTNLVTQCLVAGNPDLLERWLIQPLKKGEKILSIQDFNLCTQILEEDYIGNSQIPQKAKIYYKIIKDTLELK